MDIEEADPEPEAEADGNSIIIGEREVEAMVAFNESDDGEEQPVEVAKPDQVFTWPEVSPAHAEQYQREIQAIRESFQDEIDMLDTTMVSEYAEEIFEYMNELEVRSKDILEFSEG